MLIRFELVALDCLSVENYLNEIAEFGEGYIDGSIKNHKCM